MFVKGTDFFIEEYEEKTYSCGFISWTHRRRLDDRARKDIGTIHVKDDTKRIEKYSRSELELYLTPLGHWLSKRWSTRQCSQV